MAPFDAVKEPQAGDSAIAGPRAQAKSRWGVVVVAILLAGAGWWYFRSRGAPQTNAAVSGGSSSNSAAANGQPAFGAYLRDPTRRPVTRKSPRPKPSASVVVDRCSTSAEPRASHVH